MRVCRRAVIPPDVRGHDGSPVDNSGVRLDVAIMRTLVSASMFLRR
jgi:hypothetical protein